MYDFMSLMSMCILPVSNDLVMCYTEFACVCFSMFMNYLLKVFLSAVECYGIVLCLSRPFIYLYIFHCCTREVSSEFISESLRSCLFLVRVVSLSLIVCLMCLGKNILEQGACLLEE